MPFAVKAVQVDGGSEFMAQFEEACRQRGIRLFVLPPRPPKLNGHVERAQRTHKDEFSTALPPSPLSPRSTSCFADGRTSTTPTRPTRPSARSHHSPSWKNARRKEAGVRHHVNEHSTSYLTLVSGRIAVCLKSLAVGGLSACPQARRGRADRKTSPREALPKMQPSDGARSQPSEESP